MEIKARLECGKKVTDRATDRPTDCLNIINSQLFALKLVSHKNSSLLGHPKSFSIDTLETCDICLLESPVVSGSK